LSLTATDWLVHRYCNRFHSVSKRHETANTLIEIKNYPPVSPFHDFGESVTGNSRLWQFLPPFKLRRPFPENRGTAKQQPISAANTGAYLFHRALKQPATVRKRRARTTQRDRTATRGVQAQDQKADCVAIGGHGRHVVLGVTRFRPDQHAQSRWLENARHKTHRSAI
jgi:hypothetical protein